MAELNTPRLMAAAKEFNIGTSTLVDFLISKGFGSDELKPTSKLSEPMYRVLQSEFQQDKVAKEKAERVELVKSGGAGEPKKKRDEEDLSIKKKEAAKPTAKQEEVKPEVKEPEKPVVAEKATETPAVTKIDAPELESIKVIDKIDLDAIDSSTRPKKSTKKAAEEDKKAKVEEKVEEPKKGKKKAVKAEEKVEEVPPVVE